MAFNQYTRDDQYYPHIPMTWDSLSSEMYPLPPFFDPNGLGLLQRTYVDPAPDIDRALDPTFSYLIEPAPSQRRGPPRSYPSLSTAPLMPIWVLPGSNLYYFSPFYPLLWLIWDEWWFREAWPPWSSILMYEDSMARRNRTDGMIGLDLVGFGTGGYGASGYRPLFDDGFDHLRHGEYIPGITNVNAVQSYPFTSYEAYLPPQTLHQPLFSSPYSWAQNNTPTTTTTTYPFHTGSHQTSRPSPSSHYPPQSLTWQHPRNRTYNFDRRAPASQQQQQQHRSHSSNRRRRQRHLTNNDSNTNNNHQNHHHNRPNPNPTSRIHPSSPHPHLHPQPHPYAPLRPYPNLDLTSTTPPPLPAPAPAPTPAPTPTPAPVPVPIPGDADATTMASVPTLDHSSSPELDSGSGFGAGSDTTTDSGSDFSVVEWVGEM